ncbi:type VI secretion system tip protein TssI/VgrG [Marinomonas primoryensis]|uniref:type VI secretion system tip protein TssI/VgrG n=1 Tax=Marinomonas primoryensis TaxID=178399 RepID=UPI000DD4ADB5|nr:type VI secretion system tip protein TssI/VgrG [Marinomonas primoryensis]
MATLTFTLVLDGIEEDTLVVREYQGYESLSDTLLQDGSPCYGFRYQLSLASRRSDLSADHIVDKHAELRIVRNGLLVQRVHGIVRHFEKGDTGHHHTYYALSLVPALERLALRHNSRIFQKKTAEDIITQLLDEMGITDYLFTLQRPPQQREFCVQYRETDLHFLHRLAAEEGWVYYFTNETMALSEEGTYLKGKHTLNIVDKSQSMPKHDRAIPYNVLSGGVDNTPYISTLTEHTQSFPSQSVLKDYSFKKPDYRFLHQQEGHDMDYQHQAYEHFDSPGRFKDDNTGKAFARIRLEYLRRTAHTVVGKSNDAVIQAGTRITVTDHIDDKMNQVWVPVQVTHQGNQPQALEEEGHTGATTYHNTFTLIPTATNWQATPQPKPNVDGPMMATVVGPQDEEIYCDDHGRVKIHFPWDRYSAANDQSSCWIRVSQGWAGNQHGMMAIPRIGSEVIVSFLNGDPDQPIVTGRTYHAKNTPPYVLPEHKTKTVWRSDTHQGKGFNEISFEDQVDHEKVYLHAQKDQQEDILNDQLTQIGHDQHVNIGNDRFVEIKKDSHLTIEGECRLKVFKNKTDIIDGNLQQKVGSKAILDAAQEIHLKSGSKAVLEAASEMTIKVGGSFIKIDAAGVHIVGSAINLNTGGSAGFGSGFSGLAAALPLGATSPEYDADLEAIEGNDAPDSPLAGMVASGVPTASSDKKSDDVEEKESDIEEETTTTVSDPILQSSVLKASVALEQLANNAGPSYQKGSAEDQEVKRIQQALLKMDFDLGSTKDDGDFGSKTETAVKLFQGNYQATNNTHAAYSLDNQNGVVDQYTLLGLDEALMEGWKYVQECKLRINFEFIKQLEGSRKDGYVPAPDDSQSGVTIGSGFDIGARSLTDLKILGLPDELIKKFSPYVQVKKQEAVALLKDTPLSITDEEQILLEQLVKKSETEKIVNLYNNSESKVKFECLPEEAQTVIASVAYQNGYLPSRTPDFWTQAVKQDWNAVYDNLMDFSDAFPTRREKEAKLIKRLL